MIATAALLAFVVLTSTAGHVVLTRARWVRRFPAAGIVAWQTVTVTVLLGVALGALTLALPLLPGDHISAVLRLTPLELAHHYPNPGGALLAALATSVVAAGLLRVLVLTAHDLRAASRQRRSLLTSFEMVGTRHPDGYLLLSHAAPMVSCLPGRRPLIIVTSRAAAVLSRRQLALVLAHERVHLRVRHDVALAFAAATRRTFAWWPVFVAAHREISVLAEMQADDVVQDSHDRRELAQALAAMRVGGLVPTHNSAPSTGTQVAARLQRLAGVPGGHARAHLAGAALAGLALLATPVALALAPALDAATTGCCVYADETDRRYFPATDDGR